MTSQYQRDVGDTILRQLFEPEQRQFERQVDRLVDDNDALVGKLTEGFNYLGVNYGRNGRLGFMNSVTLDARLASRMQVLIQFRKQMECEKQLITQMVFKLITPCRTTQEMRDALPECLATMLSEKLPRTRDPAWVLVENERDMRQYRKILPKIETYSTMKYLY